MEIYLSDYNNGNVFVNNSIKLNFLILNGRSHIIREEKIHISLRVIPLYVVCLW